MNDSSRHSSHSETPTLPAEPKEKEVNEKAPANDQVAEKDPDVIIVDWDGPNDPLNPKKCDFIPGRVPTYHLFTFLFCS